jgi:AcrR family transcriptional regulator
MLDSSKRIDPRIVRTRALLYDAFVQLLAEKSFDELTVQDITARATVNRATFYAHFPDKYALLDEMIGTGFARHLQLRLQTPAPTSAAYLRLLLLAVTDHLSAISASCQRSLQTFEAAIEARIKDQLRSEVRGWLAERPELRGQPARRLDVAATVLSWSIYGAALEWRKWSDQQSAEAFADEVVPLLDATVVAASRA